MSETILDEIAESTRKRVARDKTTFSLEDVYKRQVYMVFPLHACWK